MSKRVSLTFEPMLPLAKSIHRVPEHKLSKRRLLSQREREKADLRAGEMLENAERDLWQAAEKYMQRGGSCELAIETVELAVELYLRRNPEALKRT